MGTSPPSNLLPPRPGQRRTLASLVISGRPRLGGRACPVTHSAAHVGSPWSRRGIHDQGLRKHASDCEPGCQSNDGSGSPSPTADTAARAWPAFVSRCSDKPGTRLDRLCTAMSSSMDGHHSWQAGNRRARYMLDQCSSVFSGMARTTAIVADLTWSSPSTLRFGVVDRGAFWSS